MINTNTIHNSSHFGDPITQFKCLITLFNWTKKKKKNHCHYSSMKKSLLNTLRSIHSSPICSSKSHLQTYSICGAALSKAHVAVCSMYVGQLVGKQVKPTCCSIMEEINSAQSYDPFRTIMFYVETYFWFLYFHLIQYLIFVFCHTFAHLTLLIYY